ncbi:MAG: hypothetical protein ISN64_00835 [Rickettsia sp.]|nr:hypothetical protein [Rickettsia sp.]
MFLGFNLNFEDFSSTKGLKKIDKIFLDFIKIKDKEIFDILIQSRKDNISIEKSKKYELIIIKLPILLEKFLATKFNLYDQLESISNRQEDYQIIYEAKKSFIQRYVLHRYTENSYKEIDFDSISFKIQKILGKFSELQFAKQILFYMKDIDKFSKEIDLFVQYSAYMIFTNSEIFLFNVSRKKDPDNFLRSYKIDQFAKKISFNFDYRDSINSDKISSLESRYCIYCHKKNKDSCSKGLHIISNQYKDSKLKGCPLNQKISEMNYLVSLGYYIAAMSVIILDNPIFALTGKRICNDCELSCIYQKQDPVNVPSIESNILEVVLSMPYGAEIYFLLTKWNPLNFLFPSPCEYSSRNVLVAGIGPAGIAISHYLLNLGHNVFAIDVSAIKELKIEYKKPIKYWYEFLKEISNEYSYGFGGVSDYGITSRWNKSNLHLSRILLTRRENFHLWGNVRLGSSLSIKNAFKMGFDHIILSLGAGRPKAFKFANYFSRNIYTSNEFLMRINQSKPYLWKDIDQLFIVRLPIVILGCGLSAIDSAVEAIQYYIAQLEDFEEKYLRLLQYNPALEQLFSCEEEVIIKEFLEDSRALSKLDNLGKISFLKKKNAVTILSRSRVQNSSAYSENFSEIEFALSMGIIFEENAKIKDLKYGDDGMLNQIYLESKILPVNFFITAIGNFSNDFFENKKYFDFESKYFLNIDKTISYLGDCNQFYVGSVVKALASAKDSFFAIHNALMSKEPKYNYQLLYNEMKFKFTSCLVSIKKISSKILLLKVRSPSIATNFQPGQFCRLSSALHKEDNLFAPKFFTIFDVDLYKGEIDFVISITDVKYQKIKKIFSRGSHISLLGPSGTGISINEQEYSSKIVIFIAKDIRIASIYQIAKYFKLKKFKIILFLSFSTQEYMFFLEKFSQIADDIFVNIEDVSSCTTKILQASIFTSIKLAMSKDYVNSYFINADEIFLSLDNKSLSEILFLDNIDKSKLRYFHNDRSVFCAAKGICGSCIVKKPGSEEYIFACRKHIYNFNLLDTNSSSINPISSLENIKKILTI